MKKKKRKVRVRMIHESNYFGAQRLNWQIVASPTTCTDYILNNHLHSFVCLLLYWCSNWAIGALTWELDGKLNKHPDYYLSDGQSRFHSLFSPRNSCGYCEKLSAGRPWVRLIFHTVTNEKHAIISRLSSIIGPTLGYRCNTETNENHPSKSHQIR